MKKKAAVILAVCLITTVVAVTHSAMQAFAATPNDQVAITVTGTLATNNGIAMSPLALSPAFSPTTTDYVLWCLSGVNAEQVTLSAASGSLTVTFQGPGGKTVTQTGSSVNVQVALGENQAVQVVTSQAGSAGSYWVRCLPHDFPRLSVTTRSGTPSFPGWYLTTNVTGGSTGSSSYYAMVLDQNGTPVWYQRAPAGALNFTLMNNGTFAWNPYGDLPYTTYDPSTQTTGSISAPHPPTDIHELQEVKGGPYAGDYVVLSDPLVTGQNLSSLPNAALRGYHTLIDCVVEIFNPTTGNLDWTWSAWADGKVGPDESQDAQLENYHFLGTNDVDMYHCNSVDVSPGGTNLIVSSRHMSAVFDVAIGGSQDGHVLWKLGGTPEPAVPPGATYLTIVPRTGARSDPEGTFSGQHDARMEILSGDQPTQISLYDDHSFSTDVGLKPGGARGAIYNLNVSAGTAMFVGQFPTTDSQVAASATGSFRMYNNGTDNVVGWGWRSGGSGFTEFDGSGTVLMSVSFPNGELNYRSIKVPLSALNLGTLRATAGLPRTPYPSSPAWSPVSNGQLASGPALSSWSSTHYDLFGQGLDGQLWHNTWTGSGWSGWQPLGGLIAPGTGPAAVAWSSGRIDIFVDGVDSQLWHLAWTGSSWSGWQPLGGILTASPAVTSWAANRLDVVVRGSDDAIYHLAWIGTSWYGWENLGGLSFSSPAVASWAPGRVDIVTQGSDGQAWHQWWNGSSWSGWAETLGGNLLGAPTMTSAGASELDVMAGGQAYIPERLAYQSGWQLWQPLGQSPASSAPILPQTGFTPALVALSSTLEEGCITDGQYDVQCVQLSAGTPASEAVPRPGTTPNSEAPTI